ncbi:MAG: acetyl-CoA carboxylase biotin carboxyl carrier protein subunit [Vicinamibacterales bacterium]
MSDHPTSPAIEPLGAGRYRVSLPHQSRVAYAVTHGRDTWVWLDGRAYHLSDDGEARGIQAKADEFALSAPMPATVRAIPVTVGQRVSPGDVLIVLEAMKMELAIKASIGGVVRALHCAPGELVQAGVPLVELE